MLERLELCGGTVLHVIAPFYKALDWDDLESIRQRRPMVAFNRTKTCNRIIAGELARRIGPNASSVAFDPKYVIDKTDPELAKRWPKGFAGWLWSALTVLVAKPPSTAGEPLARLLMEQKDPRDLNGALYRLDRRVHKPDAAMNDLATGRRLWERLTQMVHLDVTAADRSVGSASIDAP